ncbi:MAG: transporter [Acidobacteriia bacterium]|nr:transporter [Terriglobia bacterium]
MRKTLAGILLLLLITVSWAQDANSARPSDDPYFHDWKRELYESGIQDNSFLIEESYNQDYGVVQHINNFQRLWQSKSWVYSFTQEWPVDLAPKNQLSYTVVATHSGDSPGSGAGAGDIALNYRYQLVGSGNTRVAVAPRVSLLVPSGDAKLGRGSGGAGVQTNWAMSVVLNKKFTTHFNAGATIIPHAKDELGNSAATYAYNLGHSLVWTMHPRFNAFMETIFNRGESVIGPKQTQWESQVFVNPGIRWAYNFSSGLQIVPGISMPVGVGLTSGEKGVFFYLSFEHPYRKIPRENK